MQFPLQTSFAIGDVTQLCHATLHHVRETGCMANLTIIGKDISDIRGGNVILLKYTNKNAFFSWKFPDFFNLLIHLTFIPCLIASSRCHYNL